MTRGAWARVTLLWVDGVSGDWFLSRGYCGNANGGRISRSAGSRLGCGDSCGNTGRWENWLLLLL